MDLRGRREESVGRVCRREPRAPGVDPVLPVLASVMLMPRRHSSQKGGGRASALVPASDSVSQKRSEESGEMAF